MIYRTVWAQPGNLGPLTFKCGFCGDSVGGSVGWSGQVRDVVSAQSRIYVCPSCSNPTFFVLTVTQTNTDIVQQHPQRSYGESVAYLSPDVAAAYDEARRCFQVDAYTARVMICRKILMHIAVDVAGQEAGKQFVEYIDSLATEGYVTVSNRPWIDKIRTIGNGANHDLTPIGLEQARTSLDFLTMLLKTAYEYPARISSDAKPA